MAISLLITLLVDIAVTVSGIYVEKLASERSVPARATVVAVKTIPWQPVRHYRLTRLK